jgi:hypothetical protein
MPEISKIGPITKYARNKNQIDLDLNKSPMPIISINRALAIRKYFLMGVGMNGVGAFANCSAGQVVKMKSRPSD